MKIRAGFVTNSSSSCYVVLLPSDYKVTEKVGGFDEFFKSYLSNKLGMCEPGEEEQIKATAKDVAIDRANKFIEEARNGSQVEFGCWAINYSDLFDIMKLFENYTIFEFDGGADIPDSLVDLNAQDNMDKLKRILNEI